MVWRPNFSEMYFGWIALLYSNSLTRRILVLIVYWCVSRILWLFHSFISLYMPLYSLPNIYNHTLRGRAQRELNEINDRFSPYRKPSTRKHQSHHIYMLYVYRGLILRRNIKGAHHEVKVGKHRRNAPISQGFQGAAGPHSSARNYISGCTCWSKRRSGITHLRHRSCIADQHAGKNTRKQTPKLRILYKTRQFVQNSI